VPLDHCIVGDLRRSTVVAGAIEPGVDELYQLAADMGGAGFVFTGEHDADLMRNSALINLHTAEFARQRGVRKLFYSSSACIYPGRNQADPSAPECGEDTAYPAEPDSEYGWEKLFAERVYLSYRRNYGLDVRVARLHNTYGPGNAWRGGREKAPAALCRKVAEADDGGEVEIWGDGRQTRTFLYVDDCVDGIRALMASDLTGPANIGSETMITISDLARLIVRVAGKRLALRHVPGPTGVRGRTSENRLMHAATDWSPRVPLDEGVARTYRWVAAEVDARRLQGHPMSSVDVR
jgi:nucleoside-diphosphate-sugar epimerase